MPLLSSDFFIKSFSLGLFTFGLFRGARRWREEVSLWLEVAAIVTIFREIPLSSMREA